MGTGVFAVPSLNALIGSRHDVLAIVTQPDRPAGRGREVRMSAIKSMGLIAGLPILQPEKVRDEGFVWEVESLAPDVIVVASFGQIIPKSILGIPKYGNVNVHGSLLPKYRGAAPVHYALFDGKPFTGVTTMLMSPGLDTGPILLRQEEPILPGDNQASLEERLAEIGAGLLLETLDRLEAGTITPEAQDEARATYSPSIKREDCRINWEDSANSIVNRVRGCTPRPGAYTMWQGTPLKIWVCREETESPLLPEGPGTVHSVTSEGILVDAAQGTVLLTEVQPENRKRMSATDFARGYHIVSGSLFT